MPHPTVAIIADDLTGALDSAVPFAALGWQTVVAVTLAALPRALASGALVVAVSTASREGGADQAAAAAAQAARALAGAGVVFKKVDSRLKGHPGAELAAIAALLHPPATLVCPAIPDLGRIVQGGAVTGRGVAKPIPVAPLFPPGTLCPNAETDAALDRIIAQMPPGTLLCGARGLAAALARHLSPQARPAAAPPLAAPIAYVIGSRDPITLAQVARLRAGADALWLPAPDGALPPVPRDDPRPLILQATPGQGPHASGPEVAARLAAAAAPHLARCRSLVLTGGETAAAVLAALGLDTLEVLGEVQPGLPACRAAGRPGSPLIVTKSGGFGTEDSLLHLLPRPHALQDPAPP